MLAERHTIILGKFIGHTSLSEEIKKGLNLEQNTGHDCSVLKINLTLLVIQLRL